MIAAVFVFAIMDASMKRLSDGFAPFQVAAMRCWSSLAILCAPIAWRRRWRELVPRSPWLHGARGVLGVVTLASFVYAVHVLSLSETYALFLCAPLLMTALSVPLRGERVAVQRWIAITAGLAGALLILRPTAAAGISMLAVGAAALSAVSYALSALLVPALSRSNDSTSMVFWSLAISGAGCAAFAAPAWREIPLHDAGWLVLVGVCGALGQFWLTEAFRLAPPSVVGPFEYTAILWAFAIDWLFWSAAPSRGLLLGAAVVIASGIYVIADERRQAKLALSPANAPP